MEVVITIAVAVVTLVLGFFVGKSVYYKKGQADRQRIAEAAIGSAEKEAERIVEDAKKNAETLKKEALVEEKDEIHKSRQETEK